MYFVYLTNAIKIYTTIRYLHGVYVSYYFLHWLITSSYSGFLWVVSFLNKPKLQIEDKYSKIEIIDDYIFIK